MFTGQERVDDIKKAMELGAFGYVSKPFSWETLKDQVLLALHLAGIKKNRLSYWATLEDQIHKRTIELQATVDILERQSARMDAVTNSMGEGLIAIDNRNRIVLMNAQAEKILGIRFSQCAGATLLNTIVNPSIIAQLAELIFPECMAVTGQSMLAVPMAGGAASHFNVTIRAVIDDNGAATGRVITFLDRTDRIRADQLRVSFLSVVAHELRTPITIIMNYLACLTGIGNSEVVADMVIVCKQLSHRVDRLISLAWLSGTSITAQRKSIDIENLVAAEVEKIKKIAAEKNTTIFINQSLVSPLIKTDPQLLGIALADLLDNAVKFNRSGGTVCIGIDLVLCDTVSTLSIAITDQGRGIPEHTKSRLFESYSQGEDHLTRHHGGIGSGLFLAKRAVELLGGRIDLRSIDGEGSCFTILIPFAEDRVVPVTGHNDYLTIMEGI